jgi:CHAD domain-containing protein
MELELGLNPDDAARLPRLALLSPLRSGKARSRIIRTVWHDSPDRALAQQGLALAEQRPEWRLERLHPGTEIWPPGCPAPVVAAGRDRAALGHTLPDPLVPVAAFEGRARSIPLVTEQGPVALTVLTGTMRAVAGEHRVSRVRLEGSAQEVRALALALSAQLRLAVPRASIAAEAFAVATGVEPTPRRLGAPELPDGLSVEEAFAHAVGHLTDVILHYAPSAADDRDGPEPVHQMRVAVRRLRSAIKVFRRAIDGPAVDTVAAGLKALAEKLGPTRDWDVFVTETLAAVVDAFPAEKRLQRLQATAERRRRANHDALRAFLDTAEFRSLGIELACLAGAHDSQAAEQAAPLDVYAAHALNRPLKKLQQVDTGIAKLEPHELHGIRLRAKQLRYAAEIFATLYPGKSAGRFLRRLSTLQNRLGTLNDAAVAAGLLAELGGSGGQAFATGLVLGFVGARSERARKRIDRAWRKLHRQAPFWD